MAASPSPGRRAARWALWSLVAVVGLVVALLLVLRTGWAEDRARRLLVDRATAALDGTLTVERLDGALLSDATLYGVRLTHDGQEVFAAERVSVSYDAWRLWRSGLTFDRVEILNPRVTLLEDQTGWNVAQLVRPRPAGEPPGDPIDFGIRDLRMQGGHVVVQPLDADRREFDALVLRTRLRVEDGALTLGIESLTAHDVVVGTELVAFEGDVSIDDGVLTVDGFDVATRTSAASGTVSFRTADPLDSLAFDATLAPLVVAELAPYVSGLGELPEALRVTGDVRGSNRDVAATVDVMSRAGGASGTFDGRIGEDILTATGRMVTADLNLAIWLGQPDLTSSLNATVTFDASIPVGQVDAADVTFTASAPEVALLGYRAGRVTGKGRFVDGRLTASTSASAYGAAFSGQVQWARGTGGIVIDGQYTDVNLSRLPERLSVPPLESHLNGAIRLEGQGGAWTGQTRMTASSLEGAAIATGADASFGLAEAGLTYRFTGSVAGLDPSRLDALGEDAADALADFGGAVNADVTLDASGTTLETLAGTATLQITDTTVSGIGVETATVTATVGGQALSATIEGTVREITEQVLRMDDPPVPFRTSGNVSARVDIPDLTNAGDVGAMSGEARVTLGASTIRETSLDRATVDASLAGGVVTVRTFEASGRELTLNANGTVALEGEREADLSYTASVGDLALLAPYVDPPMSGAGTVEGHLSTGPADRAVLSGAVTAADFSSGDIRALEVEGTYELEMPGFDASQMTGTVTADATVVEVAGTPVQQFSGRVGIGNGRFEIDADLADEGRTARVSGVLVPREGLQEFTVNRLSATAGTMTWSLLEGAPAVVEYQESRLQVRGLTLANGDARIGVDGVLGENVSGGPLVARLTAVRLESLNEFLPEGRQLAGALNGSVTLTGPVGTPRIEADLVATAGALDGLEFESIGGTAAIDGRRVTVNFELEAGPLGRASIVGAVPLPASDDDPTSVDPVYDLKVISSEISLGFLQPLTTAVTGIVGTGQFDVTMTGPAEEPVLDGTIRIAGAGFQVAASGVEYQQLDADLTVRGQQVVVERLTVQDGDGHTARVQGELNLPGIGPPSGFELYVTADHLHILDNQYGDIEASASLTVMGDLQTPLLSGTITVDQGTIEASELLDRLSARGYRRAPLDQADDIEAGPYDRAGLSLTLEMGAVVVRGRDLRSGSGPLGLGDINVTVGGALTIAKETAERPTMSGAVRVERGTYRFQGRQFQIERDSDIRFQGSPTDPALNVNATREIQGVTANVRLTGTLSEPDLVLSSNPPLDQGDVLSLIVFNQAMNQLPTEQRVSLAARAGVLAAGAIATPLSDSVRQVLNLDTFEIRPSDTASGASVVIGRQVNDRLFVGFEHEFGGDEASQVSFEYRVSQLLRVVTSLSEGRGGRSLSSGGADAAAIDLIFVVR